MTTYYKIRHKKTNRWSMGGVYVPSDGLGRLWVDEGGKVWSKIGPVRSHITSHMNKYSGSTDMSDWEVVELKMVETDRKPIHEIVTPKKLMEMLTQ